MIPDEDNSDEEYDELVHDEITELPVDIQLMPGTWEFPKGLMPEMFIVRSKIMKPNIIAIMFNKMLNKFPKL